MKSSLRGLLLFCLLFSLAGCGLLDLLAGGQKVTLSNHTEKALVLQEIGWNYSVETPREISPHTDFQFTSGTPGNIRFVLVYNSKTYRSTGVLTEDYAEYSIVFSEVSGTLTGQIHVPGVYSGQIVLTEDES